MIGYRLATIVARLFEFYEILVLIWCIMSWIPRRSGGVIDDISQVLNKIVTPYLGLFRRFIPPLGGIDFSPIVALFVLGIIERFVVGILIQV